MRRCLIRMPITTVPKFTPRAKREVGFLRLIKPSVGPVIQLSDLDKLKINKEIDIKLQELENTGLSREEILLTDARKGIPLASDPFFQYLKSNYLAREIYIKVGERFTVQKVVEIALQQNIGIDPSYSNIKIPQLDRVTTVRMEDLEQQPKLEHTSFDPSAYEANANFNISKLKDELKPHQKIKYIYNPLEKYDKMRLKTRVLRAYDIHWRNVQLISQFLTRAGNIKSRFNSCLPYHQHKKVEKAIKAARSMFLIPCFGQVQVNMNRNLTTLDDEVSRLGMKEVNLETGHMYYRRKTGLEANQEREFKRTDPDSRFSKMKEDGPHYKLWLDSLKEEMKSEDFDRLTKAEAYARFLKKKDLLTKGIDISKEQNQIYATEVEKRIGVRRNKPRELTPSEEEEARKAFEVEQQRMMSESIYRFADLLVKEKTL